MATESISSQVVPGSKPARWPVAGGHDWDESGVDLSLLRWMLQLTPLERLKEMERCAAQTEALLEHGRQHRQTAAESHR